MLKIAAQNLRLTLRLQSLSYLVTREYLETGGMY